MTTTYGHLTWEEVRDADKDRVVILNVSATEDHGPHMPLDTDTVLGMAVAEGVALAAPDEVFVMPPVPYGFNEHHKDFPGVIWIQPETLIAFVTDVTKSLAHHGFRRILLLNSHGSNHPCLDLAARKTVIETAMYMHLHPGRVHIEKSTTQNLHNPDSKFFNLDLAGGGGGAMLMRWWSEVSPDGTMGDPTVADPETGKKFLAAAIEETTALIREIRALPFLQRRDHH